MGVCPDSMQAEVVKTKIAELTTIPLYITRDSSSYKIQVGYFSSPESAKASATELQQKGYSGFVVEAKFEPAAPVKPTEEIIPQVAIPPVQPKPSIVTKGFYVEVDVFKEKEKAEQLQKKLQNEFSKQTYILEKPPYYRVIFVDFGSVDEAMEMVSILQNLGYKRALLMFEEPGE